VHGGTTHEQRDHYDDRRNLTRDPEIRYTREGQATTNLGVATNRRWQNRETNEWEEATSFFDVVIWRDLAENVALSLTKGMRVIVTGRSSSAVGRPRRAIAGSRWRSSPMRSVRHCGSPRWTSTASSVRRWRATPVSARTTPVHEARAVGTSDRRRPGADGARVAFGPRVVLTKEEAFGACQALADAGRVLVRSGGSSEADTLCSLFVLLEDRLSTG